MFGRWRKQREKVLTASLVGGLGNQLSIYAFARSLADSKGCDLVMDYRGLPARGQQRGSTIEDLGIRSEASIRGSFLTNFLYRHMIFRYFRAPNSKVYRAIFGVSVSEKHPTLPNSFTRKARTIGYFTDPTWVGHDFPFESISLAKPMSTNVQRLLHHVSKPDNICLHHRLGDSLQLSKTRGILGMEYFNGAINKLRDTEGRIFVFSDDVTESQKRFRESGQDLNDFIFVGDELSAAEVFFVMSQAARLVISNSSISWWSAKMNKNGIIVTPSTWTRDGRSPANLLSEDWKTVESSWE